MSGGWEGEGGHSCSQEPPQVSPLHHSPLFLWLIYVQVEVLFLAKIGKNPCEGNSTTNSDKSKS